MKKTKLIFYLATLVAIGNLILAVKDINISGILGWLVATILFIRDILYNRNDT